MIETTNVQYVKGVGPALAKELAKLGIVTVKDLLWFFPSRYEDRRRIYSVTELKPDGAFYQIKAKVLRVDKKKTFRRNITLVKALLADTTGSIVATWFNQPYIVDLIRPAEEFIFYGRVIKDSVFGWQLACPEVEPLGKGINEFSSVGRIVPVYPLGSCQRLSQKRFRKIMQSALERYSPEVEDIIGALVKGQTKLLELREALWQIHFPSDMEMLEEAKRRFIFDEFFLFSWFVEIKKQERRAKRGRKYIIPNPILTSYIRSLPFEFTVGQKNAIDQICKDLTSDKVMHRLLQGDVGSGKTVVAFYASCVVLGSGYQVAVMVPTEILARQHYEKAKVYLKDIVDVELLVGSMTRKAKEKVLRRLQEDKPVLVIGTHTLIESKVKFAKLGLVIIDEQHRFGVKQRMYLSEKSPLVDVLVMTATPIPRSLAMTLYGDLDLTVIDDLPAGRRPVKTVWITSDRRYRLYDFIRSQVKEGRQVYIVYPLVGESDTLDLLAAEEMYRKLSEEIFPDLRVGMIHGKMKAKEKDEIMKRFYNKEIDILVATVVIEVGIDVPNASVMVIEHAERFGLSQLHQLRGRIGRGEYQSYCVVVSDTDNPDTKRRLGVFLKYNDGFKLSEADLVLRGPGQFVGERQHGPTEFHIGNPITDFSLLRKAKETAAALISKEISTLLKDRITKELTFFMRPS